MSAPTQHIKGGWLEIAAGGRGPPSDDLLQGGLADEHAERPGQGVLPFLDLLGPAVALGDRRSR